PARRLSAGPRADPGVHRVVLGAARVRRTAAGAIHAVDPGPVHTRSVFRAAPAHGREYVLAAATEPGAGRSRAGEGHEVPARDLHGVLRVLPVRPGAVLARQQPDFAVATGLHHEEARRVTAAAIAALCAAIESDRW